MEGSKKYKPDVIWMLAIGVAFISRFFGFVFDVLALSLAFVLVFKHREYLADYFIHNNKITYITILLSALPFILFEELINAPLSIFVISVPGLSLSILLLIFFAKKIKARKMAPSILIYAIIGVLFEVKLGASSTEFATLDPFSYNFMIFWVGLSYIFLALVPFTIYLKQQKKT